MKDWSNYANERLGLRLFMQQSLVSITYHNIEDNNESGNQEKTMF
jgi:hypothetical protein